MSCENQFKNFKIATQSWIDCLRHQLSVTDKDSEVYKKLETDLEDSKRLLYTLTGKKSKEFKEILCSE